VEGLDNLYNIQEEDKLEMLKSDVICLVETWKSEPIKLSGVFSQYELVQQSAIRTAKRGRAKGGLMILAKRKTVSIINATKRENCILGNLKISGSNECLGVAYIYIQPSDHERKLEHVTSKTFRWMESISP
jgi:hypothetical protein